MGVLLVFLVSWKRGRYIRSDQQGDIYNMATFIEIPSARPRVCVVF